MTPNPQPRWILRRAMKNAGLLSIGKGAAGVMQLATFALAARGLGLTEFGLFSMLLAQVQLFTGLAAFQSNQAIVSYGVGHLQKRNMRAFQSLIKIGALLDGAAALLAAAATILVAPLVGALLGWNEDIIFNAQIIAPLALTNANATPKGLLRLFGRFDLLMIHALVTPAARLAGACVAAVMGAPLGFYLAVWLLAGLVGAGVAIFLAAREAARHDCIAGFDGSLRRLGSENAGVWRFSILSNLHSTIALVPEHLSTFLIGTILGPAAAGLFRVAREVGTGLAKPVDLLNQSVFPDIARLVVSRDWRRLRGTVIRAGLFAAGTSAIVTLLIVIAGELAVIVVFGEDFAEAVPVLILISLSTTIAVLGFAVVPMMYALGRPAAPLVTSLIANTVFIALLLWRVPVDGISGAGLAYLGLAIATLLISIVWAAQTMPPATVRASS